MDIVLCNNVVLNTPDAEDGYIMIFHSTKSLGIHTEVYLYFLVDSVIFLSNVYL